MYSLQTRMKALAIAGVMAASVAGSAVTAFAAVSEENTLKTNGITVQKNIEVAQGITFAAKNFEFKATFMRSSNKTTGPALTGGTISDLTQNKKCGQTTMARWSEFQDSVPGEYVYELSENSSDAPAKDALGYGWTYSTTKYLLRVYVSNNTNAATKATQPKIVKYTLVEEGKVDGKEEKTQDYDDQKTTVASFSNIYTKRGNSGTDGDKTNTKENPSLVVDKTVVGAYGDMNQYFKFTVTFNTPPTDNRTADQRKFKMTFNNNKNGTYASGTSKGSGEYDSTTPDITLTDNGSYVFYLKNGGSVAFDNLPAGTTYTLAETKATTGTGNYTATFAVEDGNGNTTPATVDEENVIKINNGLIGENANKIEVTNTYDDSSITITGVVTHSAPFVIMVGALFVAVGGYVVLKKRIEE